MSHDPPREPPREDDVPDLDLPPLADDDGDELGIDDPLDGFIQQQRDDGMSWLDDSVGIEDYDDNTIAREIGAFDGNEGKSWIKDSEGDEELEGTEADIGGGEEYGWVEDSDVPAADEWEYGLELSDEEGPSILDDGGEEGLDEDDLGIDTSAWSDFDDEVEGEGADDDWADELLLDTGMTYEQELRIDGGLLPPALDEALLKAVWLGPAGAPAVTVSFRSGRLYAAGMGLFRATADTMIPTPASSVVEDSQANSLEIDPRDSRTLYIGTMLGGLLISRDGGATIEAVNGWTRVVEGCGSPERPTVPVRVAVSAPPGQTAGASTVWLLTGQGHLLRSHDGAQTWAPIATEAEVLALAADPAGSAVAALARRGDELSVLWSADGRDLAPRELPESAEALIDAPEPALAVRDRELLVGAEELLVGTLYSPSPEAGWVALEDCPRASALAFLGFLPETFLAGLFFTGRDLGTLLRTPDAGESWVRVCDVSRLREIFAVEARGAEDVSHRIHEIAVNSRTPRVIAVATGHGVFIVEMKDLLVH